LVPSAVVTSVDSPEFSAFNDIGAIIVGLSGVEDWPPGIDERHYIVNIKLFTYAKKQYFKVANWC